VFADFLRLSTIPNLRADHVSGTTGETASATVEISRRAASTKVGGGECIYGKKIDAA
jgi:hypothetical protein